MSRLAISRSTKTSKKKKSPERKFTSYKKSPETAHNNIYASSIDNFLNNLKKIAKHRTSTIGSKDPIAKKLNNYASNTRSQIRKSNIVNPYLAKCLNDIHYSIRGIKSVPNNVKAQIPRIFQTLRQGVHKDVMLFLGTINRIVRSMTIECAKWETHFEKCYENAKKGTSRYTLDHAAKRQMISWQHSIAKFKTKWNQKFNLLANYANPQVRASLKTLKTELENLHKAIQKNRLHSRAALRASAAKKVAGKKAQALVTKADWKSFQNSIAKKQKQIENTRHSMTNFHDQLKTIKACC